MLSYNQYLTLIEQSLSALRFPSTPRGLYQPIEYTLQGGGKRLRPVLLLASADACGLPPKDVMNQALGIEMFHNFTLLHDDVMDNSGMRRGRPTVNVKWNDNTAILSGDAMLTSATQLIVQEAGDAMPDVLSMFNTSAMQVYEGQQFDMDFEERTDVTVKEYLDMIYLKTSVLLACACAIGVIMAGGGESKSRAMYDYAGHLGMAFQLRDDLLDTFGDPATFGKPIGGDIRNNKKTWLLITALEEAPEEISALIDLDPTDEKVAAVTAVYRRLSLEKRCQDLIDSYARKALDALDAANLDAGAREFFAELTERLSSRRK